MRAGRPLRLAGCVGNVRLQPLAERPRRTAYAWNRRARDRNAEPARPQGTPGLIVLRRHLRPLRRRAIAGPARLRRGLPGAVRDRRRPHRQPRQRLVPVSRDAACSRGNPCRDGGQREGRHLRIEHGRLCRPQLRGGTWRGPRHRAVAAILARPGRGPVRAPLAGRSPPDTLPAALGGPACAPGDYFPRRAWRGPAACAKVCRAASRDGGADPALRPPRRHVPWQKPGC